MNNIENVEKYLQKTLILNKSEYVGKNETKKYNYVVAVKVWENERFIAKLKTITTENDYEIGNIITVKSNKTHSGEIYFTEYEELPF